MRELENEIERAVVLAQGNVITSHSLNLSQHGIPTQIDLATRVRNREALNAVLAEVERVMLLEALRQSDTTRKRRRGDCTCRKMSSNSDCKPCGSKLLLYIFCRSFFRPSGRKNDLQRVQTRVAQPGTLQCPDRRAALRAERAQCSTKKGSAGWIKMFPSLLIVPRAAGD